MDTVLLTGATGFLGSHLLRGLLNKTDCNIVILKRSFSNIDRIVEFTDVKRIKSYDIDCVDLETVFKEMILELLSTVQRITGVFKIPAAMFWKQTLCFPLNFWICQFSMV